ncbi:D-alanyl-D-alanine carboxypeptidase family protein [Oricola sp.]|uniref:D-alanyl-D-alanine carboxypeptidase family protein n=1 Tax=Oricola sp. TaxID=1979950 RepID=UPI0025E35EEE|nr:D-alanyl-D-alanine carboxypeptidase family protein [Oricola sp.]MCI5076514.1 D-alanyl-D-alanine carboxypeptidase [Oricola sp.]
MAMIALTVPAAAQMFESRAEQAILLDSNTGTILYAKNADQKVPPASLAKLMTMEVVFNALKAGRLSMDDEFLVSENAWRSGGASSGGSTMFAELNSSIRLEDLIQGVIVQSANDGCIIIAEGMAGSEEVFASLMNDRAKKIGLDDSHFTNSTGLPDPLQKVTMRDLAKLGDHIRREYPEYYKYYAQRDFTWNKILQRNRNPLLTMNIGADGMKTGHTEESGYAIVGSIERDGRRLIVAMSGLESSRARAEEARKLLEWGARAFEPYEIFKKGDEIGNVRLYGGAQLTVPVTVKEDLDILLPITDRDRMKARVVYTGPVMAPVEEGQEIATLKVWIGDTLTQETPLYAAQAVPQGPIYRRALDALTELALGWI